MNPLHLIWIVPMATMFGWCLCAIFSMNKE